MHKTDFFPADIRLNILAAIRLAGFFSAANPVIGYG